jgi:hypothetical protein
VNGLQIAENWSRIRGTVEGWEPPRRPGASGTLTIAVEQVDDVVPTDGTHHRNLLVDATGTTVRVTVPASAAAHVRPQKGETAVIEVRRGRSPDRVFAHPKHITLARK